MSALLDIVATKFETKTTQQQPGGCMFYFLDTDPQRAARLLADGDIRSQDAIMVLAAVLKQMRLRVDAGASIAPANLMPWVRGCITNWDWSMLYVQEILNEHLHRFGRLHAGVHHVHSISEVESVIRSRLPKLGHTIPPIAPYGLGPGGVTGELNLLLVSYVTRWRWFYGATRRGATYTRREIPDFIEERRLGRERRQKPRIAAPDRRKPEEDHVSIEEDPTPSPVRVVRTRRRFP